MSSDTLAPMERANQRLCAQVARLRRDFERTEEWNRRAIARARMLQRAGIGTEQEHAFVYLVRCRGTGFSKIGSTNNPTRRLSQMQVVSSSPLHLRLTIRTAHAKELEQALHRHFDSVRVRGEWFMLDNEQVERLAGGWLPNDAARWGS